MLAAMYIGVAKMPTVMRIPCTIFSKSEMRVRGGPETQVWCVKFRTNTLVGMTVKARLLAAIMVDSMTD
jgi:hypothetical protein